MYTKEFLDCLKQTEETLVFSSFDREDAFVLGTKLRAAGMEGEQPVSVRVELDGMLVFLSFPDKTDADNGWWMERKCATVMRNHSCSLRALVERELYGAKEAWQSDEEHHAFCGGGFPIVVDGVLRGAAAVSALPHLEDHALLVKVISEWLGRAVPALPAVE